MEYRRRVVFIINSLAGGGAERVMSTLLTASASEYDEFDVELVLLDVEDSPYKLPKGIRVHQLDCRQSFLKSVIALARLFPRIRPDISMSFLTRANMANVFASIMYGTPCIISERVNKSSQWANNFRGRLAKLLVRFIYPRATRIITVSPGVAQDLRTSFSVPVEKIAVVPNPVDLISIRAQSHETLPISLDEPYVMGMGRLSANKNFGLLIDAFALSGLSGKLLILGEGPARQALTLKIANLGLIGRVIMPGFATNPFAYMRRASVFVLPSNSEGFPNSLVEAMAVGIPVISTNCGSGPSEILADCDRERIEGVCFGEYGVLVPQNSPQELANALLAFENADLRRKYGERATTRAAEFSIERAKAQYWGIVRAAIGRA